ncbi:hypothetical protein ACFL2T_07290 [Elusimicrobiota bacterium]
MSNPKDDKERKGGGVLPWASGAAKVPPTPGLTLATTAAKISGVTGKFGGLGAMAVHAKILAAAKIGLGLLTVAGIGISGYGVYDMGRRGGFGQDPTAIQSGQVKLFDKRSPAPNVERGIFGGSAAPSSLGLANKANQGAFDAPEGEVEESADAVGEDEFADEDVEESDGGAAGDPAAMAEQMAAGMMDGAQGEGAKAKEGLGNRFGKLSSGMGGGGSSAKLSGGSGLAGGIGKGFGRSTKLSNSQADKLSAMRKGRKAGRTRSKTAARNRGGRHIMGKNANKLSNMQGAMSSANNAGAEGQAATHSGEWDGAGATGEGISGAGADGIGGGGGFDGNEGTSSGGPVAQEPTSGSSSGSSGSSSGGTEVPDTGPGTNMTPYQMLVDLATLLNIIVTILLAVLVILAAFKVLTPGAAEIILKIVIGLSILEALCGIGIMMMGQGSQGGLFTAIGALMATCAWIAYAAIPSAATHLTYGSNCLALTLTGLAHGALGGTAGFGMGDSSAFDS